MANEETAKYDDPENHDCPEHVAVVLGALFPEVDQYDTDAVKCVVDYRGYESGFTKRHVPVFIGTDYGVVGFGRDADQRSIQHVDL